MSLYQQPPHFYQACFEQRQQQQQQIRYQQQQCGWKQQKLQEQQYYLQQEDEEEEDDLSIDFAMDNSVAIQLNEQGARQIETGDYEGAIQSLVKAIHTASQLQPCPSDDPFLRPCMLADCLRFSSPTKRTAQHQELQEPEAMFRTPLRIPPSFARVHPDLVDLPVLSLVITFNLALVHQLSALQQQQQRHHRLSGIVLQRRLQQSMDLYEVAYKWQLEETRAKGNNSAQFVLMILSNMAEIHKVLGNTTKQHQCLQHVLSAVMHLVDISNRSRGGSSGSEDEDHDMAGMNLDRFLVGTMPLILQRNCADAA